MTRKSLGKPMWTLLGFTAGVALTLYLSFLLRLIHLDQIRHSDFDDQLLGQYSISFGWRGPQDSEEFWLGRGGGYTNYKVLEAGKCKVTLQDRRGHMKQTLVTQDAASRVFGGGSAVRIEEPGFYHLHIEGDMVQVTLQLQEVNDPVDLRKNLRLIGPSQQ